MSLRDGKSTKPIFSSREDSRNNSRENSSLSKCHCSEIVPFPFILCFLFRRNSFMVLYTSTTGYRLWDVRLIVSNCSLVFSPCSNWLYLVRCMSLFFAAYHRRCYM